MTRQRGSESRGGVLALVSGGLDSFCLVQMLLRQGAVVCPVFVRCGFVWESVERFWLRRWLSQIRHPNLRPLAILHAPLRSFYGGHWSLTGRGIPSARSADHAVYLPGRNILLLSHAALYATRQGLSDLAMGTLAGNPFTDTRPDFLTRFARCLSQALSHPIRILVPWRRCSKAQLIAANPGQPFQLTWSCLRPRGLRHCGRCNKCAERKRAFRQARIPDPTKYAG